jgi:hypothetical protein
MRGKIIEANRLGRQVSGYGGWCERSEQRLSKMRIIINYPTISLPGWLHNLVFNKPFCS